MGGDGRKRREKERREENERNSYGNCNGIELIHQIRKRHSYNRERKREK